TEVHVRYGGVALRKGDRSLAQVEEQQAGLLDLGTLSFINRVVVRVLGTPHHGDFLAFLPSGTGEEDRIVLHEAGGVRRLFAGQDVAIVGNVLGRHPAGAVDV